MGPTLYVLYRPPSSHVLVPHARHVQYAHPLGNLSSRLRFHRQTRYGKLNVVPNTLSRIFSEVDGKPLPSEPQLAAICRNVPDYQPFHPPNPREYELSAGNLDEIVSVESDRELFASAISVFPLVDAAKLLAHERK